ncbi:hypothetical protein B296_00033500 [Ensete ventricosum]|uniref:Uncharacterized protein n=1 Tax=Ensete ventricosum TaxID=4639 RepID=A0A427AAQ0_ENSVE|nr:hypothetical protein B296_00033500 [Ensete ventricosum]
MRDDKQSNASSYSAAETGIRRKNLRRRVRCPRARRAVKELGQYLGPWLDSIGGGSDGLSGAGGRERRGQRGKGGGLPKQC